ncbi:alpha/beta hydrolase [Paenibacillus sp. N1-5-1-14]|uniref:alpha/beta fold hydrolase n=1 Tax=Paenibacillus radicibacter TaxID=2972488 RepID=UPI0021593F49|nr:alpha/beta hydrolase [Paenibacillus radicibacter]MCR8645354.1 alpha/beta hydrolase [Paenibacillus radicibacter]
MQVRINRLTLDVTDKGQGPALLLLHGYPLDHRMWEAQIEFFRHTHRVIAPDLRGMGQSEGCSTNINIDQYADDIIALLDELGINRVTVAGFSMGGYVLFALLRKAPSRISAIVLVNTRADSDTLEGQRNRLEASQHLLEHGASSARQAMLSKLLSDTTVHDQPQLVDQVGSWMQEQTPIGLVHAQLAMAFRPDSTSMLASIKVPTIVIGGEHDKIIPPALIKQLASSIPNAKYRLIAETAHLTPVEKPDAFNNLLSDFLGKAHI